MKVELVNKKIHEKYGEQLLQERGVKDIDLFLNPTRECLEDWRDLSNIEKGLDLIKALKGNERIGTIIDPDVDGITSFTIIYKYLKRLMPELQIDYYIHEGKKHGVEEHFNEIKGKNYDLFIIVDAGSNDGELIKEWKFHTLVIDHHIVDVEKFSDNMTVVNNQISLKYKNKSQSGAGLAYQFCRGLDHTFNKNWADDYLDLAAVGSIADMMSSLEYENRYIWTAGLSKINNHFLYTLIMGQAYSITKNSRPADFEVIQALNPIAISFYVAPLINAMIRVGTPDQKERMIKAFLNGEELVESNKRGSKGEMVELSKESFRECGNARSRQTTQRNKASNLLANRIEKKGLLDNEILLIKLQENDTFPPEMNGLIATELVSKYKKPVMIGRENMFGEFSGSIRAKDNTALPSFKDYLTSTGLFHFVSGHDSAAGYSLNLCDIENLHKKANKDLAKYNLGESSYKVNFIRQASDSDLVDLIYDLEYYKDIWGNFNPEPSIYIENIYLSPEEVQVVGRNQNTLKFMRNEVSFIQFNADELIQELSNCEDLKLSVIGTASVNEWNGIKTPQIIIRGHSAEKSSIFDF